MHGLEAHLRSSPISSATAFGLDGREHGVPPAVLPSVEKNGTSLCEVDGPSLSEVDGPSISSSEHESVRVLIADDSATSAAAAPQPAAPGTPPAHSGLRVRH